MTEAALFAAALGLPQPWYIEKVTFLPGSGPLAQGEVTIEINFYKGSRFTGSDGGNYSVYDTAQRTWQHLNFFQHKCLIQAPSPRIKLANGKVETVELPWARPGSHFTLLFEAYIMLLIKSEMPLFRVGKMLGVTRDRVEVVFNHYVEKARTDMDCSTINVLGIDETSISKGHKYVTVGVDLETRKVVSVVEGKDSAAVGAIKADLETKEVMIEQVTQLSMDMSQAFIKGAEQYFPTAEITFDKFHIVKLINDALDQTRRIEQARCKGLKKTRYRWLGNEDKMTEMQREELEKLSESFPNMGEAYRMKLQFKTFWQSESIGQAEAFLRAWIQKAKDINQPFERLAKTLERILNHIVFAINNGILEGINSKIQLAKRRARGYRNINNFINMIYYIAANLKFDLPTLNT